MITCEKHKDSIMKRKQMRKRLGDSSPLAEIIYVIVVPTVKSLGFKYDLSVAIIASIIY